MTAKAIRIACGISGGVDSAVAALLLKRKGYNVTGVFMNNWDIRDEKGKCTIDNDREDARYVCKTLGIPLTEVDFVKQFWHEVFSDMVQDYQKGITPNPDILCNRHIKFNHFVHYATSNLGVDAIATGHYARTSVGYNLGDIDPVKGVSLLCAADGEKDQTFFLSQIPQWALQKSIFPLGDLHKHQVKAMAAEAGMDKIANKKESMGICFIGSRNFQCFIEEYIEPAEGNFVDVETGEVVGRHKGTHYWTLGQRCHLGGKKKAYFVCDVQVSTQTILVAGGTDNPALFTQTFLTDSCHWVQAPPTPASLHPVTFEAEFRFQHRHALIGCMGTLHADGSCHVTLERPLRALTPGQYSVFYKHGVCLGSARISTLGPSLYELGQVEQVKFPKEFS